MKVSDFVIEYFKRNEVDTCFTIAGGGCIHLIDSLRKSKLQTICPHHEQSVLMASEGYYRQSGKMSLNIVTTGPGGTNTLTGLLGMWLDSIPSVIISGQVPLNQISRGTGCRQIGDQEFDIISCVKNMTKYSVMIENPQDIIHEVKKAHALAKTGRPGPTWIDIPLDIQGADIKVSEGSFIPYNKLSKKAKNYIALEKLLEESKKPLIIVGNGVRLSNTYDKLDHFLKKTNIPVVTGPHSGVDVVDNTLKNYCGRIGILGQLTSNQIVQECDLILCLGSRLPVKMTGYNIPEFSPKSKKVIVDVDVSEIRKHKFDVELSYQSDLNDFFDNIKVPQMEISDWINETQKIRESQEYVHRKHENLKSHTSFYNLINQAPDVFGDTPIVTSNGTAHVVTLQMYRLNKNQRLFTNVGCASMGFGLPAAIGACVGNDRKDVICIEGDGSLMMNLQELETVVSQKLPIKLMIINNDGYLSIKMTQESFFSGQEFASGPETGVTIPSYEKVAKAFGIPYLKMTKNDNIKNELKEMMSIDGPCIMEIFTHPNEKHEPKVMHKGVGEDGKIIPGSLTDMQIADTI
jgi:acetolactate synthase I/II/III large subunit